MIKQEPWIRSDGVELVKTYSDAGLLIRQIETGTLYSEAIDVLPLRYTYEESDEPIADELSAEEALDILLGGDEHDEV